MVGLSLGNSPLSGAAMHSHIDTHAERAQCRGDRGCSRLSLEEGTCACRTGRRPDAVRTTIADGEARPQREVLAATLGDASEDGRNGGGV